MSYEDDSGYGSRKATGGYGEDSEGGFKATTYGDDITRTEEGGYQRKSGYGDEGGYGKPSGGYGGDDAVSGYGRPKKDSDGDGIPDEFEKSQYNREDVEDLKNRTDIDEEEKDHRRKVLMAEVAAGVVGAGVLGIAGYAVYQHFNKDDDEAGEEGTGFFGRKKKNHDDDEVDEDRTRRTGRRGDDVVDDEEGYGKKSSYGEDEDQSSGYGRKKSGGYGRKMSGAYGEDEEEGKDKKSWF